MSALKVFFKGAGKFLKRHAPKILAGVAIGSEIAGFIFMHHEAPIVRDRLDELPEDATTMDKVKVALPVYLPACGALLLSSGAMVTAVAMGEHRAAVLASLFSASEATLAHERERITKALGRGKTREIIHDTTKDELEEAVFSSDAANTFSMCNSPTGPNDDRFFEPLSGRWFWSTPTKVYAASVRINDRLRTELDITGNEWFSELGIDTVGLGDFVHWTADHPMDIPDGEIVKFATTKTPDGHPCFAITYFNRPLAVTK